MNNKYPDYFTEYKLPNFKNAQNKCNTNLHNLFPTPITDTNYKNVNHILYEIFTHFAQGTEFNLYIKYQKKYGTRSMSDNFLIPFYDEHNKIITDLVILCHPDDCERIAKSHLNKAPNFLPILTDSVISTTNIDHWKYQRQQFIPTFSPINSLENIIHISQKRAKKCSKLLSKLRNKNLNIDINDFFLNETQAQLQLALFGVTNKFEKKHNKKIREAFKTNGERGYLRKTIFEIIENIKNNKFNGPMSKILKKYDKKTDTELYGNIMLLLFAGHDTTGHTLSWLVFELCKNMSYQIKVHNEVDKFWKKQKNKPISISDFKRLPFLNLCIFETLRLYPAVANGSFRQLQNDEYVYGLNEKKVLIPKGTYIQIPNYFRHRNPNLWDKPMIFNPYREFSNDEIWTNGFSGKNPESYRYSPFMYNSRSCLGKHFANIEMRIILLYLFKEYIFVLSPDQKSKDIECNQMTMGPLNGLYVNIIDRKSKL